MIHYGTYGNLCDRGLIPYESSHLIFIASFGATTWCLFVMPKIQRGHFYETKSICDVCHCAFAGHGFLQIADLDALAQSIFLNTFGDPISNPKGWEMKPIKELTIKMSTGPFGSMLHKEDYSADGIPSINPQDIKGNQISNANIARVNIVKAKELRKYVLDVLPNANPVRRSLRACRR